MERLTHRRRDDAPGMVGTLLDGSGRCVGQVTVSFGEDEIAIEEAPGNRGWLLRAYFGEGLRTVWVDLGDVRIPGVLRTRRHRRRAWSVVPRPARTDGAGDG
ncbi:MAG: hypothetical protein Kow0010_13130 [Dehalococcoidia bacterium]